MRLRPATPADAAAIAGIQARAWWHAYDELLEPRRIAAHLEANGPDVWRARLAEPGRVRTVVAATADGTVRGYAVHGPSRLPERPGDGELLAINVDPPAQGAGVGGVLLDAVHAGLAAEGHDHAVLLVFDGNGHARRFYAARGWSPDGDAFPSQAWGVPDLRMRRAL